MEKQTAVEWFIDQLEQQGESWENVSMGTINISIKVDEYLKLKDKAKEMFEQQIKDSWENGFRAFYDGSSTPEDYYKKTFKSEQAKDEPIIEDKDTEHIGCDWCNAIGCVGSCQDF
jgi:hypothetical protein